MLFVTDKEIAGAITAAVAKAASLKMAVAFWGRCAPELLGLDAFDGRARIVCDASSGACNPDVLALLMVRHDVRTLKGMHAKVYWTPEAAIVGSANASVNGLRSEAVALRYEAAMVTRDPAMLTKIEAWFDVTFGQADPLDEQSLGDIRRRWEEAQAQRPSAAPTCASLLKGLKDTPDDFANRRLFVIVLEQGDPSEEALRAYDRVKGSLFLPEEVQSLEEMGTVPFYEDRDDGAWDVRPNDVFIEFSRGPRGSMSFTGFWQIRNNAWRHSAGGSGSIILVDQIEQIDASILDTTDARKLGKALQRMIQADKASYDADGFCRPLNEIRAYLDV